MAKKEKKEVVEKAIEEPKLDDKVEKLKVKKSKMKKIGEPTDNVIKVDLKELTKKAEDIVKIDTSKPVEEIEVPEQKVEEVVEEIKTPEQEVQTTEQAEDTPILQEVTEDSVEENVIEDEIEVPVNPELPENVQKLMNFMDDTGGDLNDYVQLNRDISKMDNSEAVSYTHLTLPTIYSV